MKTTSKKKKLSARRTKKVNNGMKFSEFKQACRDILDRIGREQFMTLPLRLHDVERSSSFAQAVYPASSVAAAKGNIDVRPGRSRATLTQILSRMNDIVLKTGGDPAVTVAGDKTFVFGYDM